MAENAKEKMVKVVTPNRAFSGIRMGVKFKVGEAICTESKARLLHKAYKYAIENIPSSEKSPSTPPASAGAGAETASATSSGANAAKDGKKDQGKDSGKKQ